MEMCSRKKKRRRRTRRRRRRLPNKTGAEWQLLLALTMAGA